MLLRVSYQNLYCYWKEKQKLISMLHEKELDPKQEG